MRKDVEVTVAHAVPVLMRGRRGGALSRVDATLSTPARLRHVRIDDVRKIRRIGVGIAIATLTEFEGRLWKPVRGLGGDAGVREVAASLSGECGCRLPDLHGLHLDPWNVRDHYGRLAESGKVVDGDAIDPGKLALDLRAEARSEAARRVRDLLFHDGEIVWRALPHPMLDAQQSKVTVPFEPPPDKKLPFHPVALAQNVERYLDYLAAGPSVTGMTEHRRDRICRAGRQLDSDLSGLPAPPLADVLRGVGRLAIRVYEGHRTTTRAQGPSHEEMVARMAALHPVALRASAGLLHVDDLPDAVDRLKASLDLDLSPERTRHVGASQIHYAFKDAAAYLATFAFPLMAERALPQNDLDSLGGLAPGGFPR